MSLTHTGQSWVNRGVRPGQSRWRLAAGEAERGGGARDRRSGDHLGGGDHGRGANARPRHLEQVGETGVAEARRKRARGGGRSSAKCAWVLQGTAGATGRGVGLLGGC